MRDHCPACGKRLFDRAGVINHIKMKHKKNAEMHLAKLPAEAPKREREQSMAELSIEAELNRAMGIPNEPWIDDMFPA